MYIVANAPMAFTNDDVSLKYHHGLANDDISLKYHHGHVLAVIYIVLD